MPDTPPAEASQLFVLSSFDQDGVSRMRTAYTNYLATHEAKHLGPREDAQFHADLAYTLGTKRTHHAWRSFSIAASPSSLHDSLQSRSTDVVHRWPTRVSVRLSTLQTALRALNSPPTARAWTRKSAISCADLRRSGSKVSAFIQ